MSEDKILKTLVTEAHNIGAYDLPEDKIVRVLDKGFVRLVDSMGSDAAIAQAARVSYGAGTKKVSDDSGLIRYLLRNAHSTPFEMVQIKLHVKAPIFVIRQWHRHRSWSYNEISGRYSEMPDEFYVPAEDKVTKQNPHNKQGGIDELIPDEDGTSWSDLFASQQNLLRHDYEIALKTGMRKELARINLPLSQYSEMYASVDLHNLFHFLKLRLDNHAQYEIQVYAQAIATLIKPIVPIAYQAFEDYRLNSITLNSTEQTVLRVVLADYLTEENISLTAEKYFSNKRERKECVDKLVYILLKQK